MRELERERSRLDNITTQSNEERNNTKPEIQNEGDANNQLVAQSMQNANNDVAPPSY